MKRKKSDYIVQSVSKALDILEILASSEEELGINELSQKLSIQKSNTSRLTHTIEHRGYIEKNLETGGYRIGLKAFEIGHVYLQQLGLSQAARPVMNELVNRCDESAYLATLKGPDVVYLDVVQTSKPLRLASRVGTIAPAYCTASGKVQMAFLSREALDEILDKINFKPLTEKSIADGQRFREELKKTVKRGYAIDDQEFEMGVRGIAAPIWDHTRKVIAGISLSGPISRMSPERVESQLLPLVLEAGMEISRRLGFDPAKLVPSD